MMKFMWFMAPAAPRQVFFEAWLAAADLWSAPASVRRWHRCFGALRADPLSRQERDAPAALEEIWCAATDAVDVRAHLLDASSGLTSAIGAVAEMSVSELVLTSESVIIDGPEACDGNITNAALWRRQPALSRGQAQAHWRDVHAPMVIRDGGIMRYVQCFIEDENSIYDGAAIIDFESREMRDAFVVSEAYRMNQLPDTNSFTDAAHMRRFAFTQYFEALASR